MDFHLIDFDMHLSFIYIPKATCLGYTRDPQGVRRMCSVIENVMHQKCHGLREMGSGVLSLCYLACGRVDAVYAGTGGKPSRNIGLLFD